MDTNTVNHELPENYEQLKNAANRSDWRERLAAVQELGQWNHPKTIDVLTHRMLNDTVYAIQEAAHKQLQGFGVDAKLPPRKTGELVKGLTKILVRIKKSLPEGHSYEAFKEKLHKTRLDVYNAYEGDKGAEFDQWLESTWESLSTR